MSALDTNSGSLDIAMLVYASNDDCRPEVDADPVEPFYCPAAIQFPFDAITPSQASRAVTLQSQPRLSLPIFNATGWLLIVFLSFLLLAALASHVSWVASTLIEQTQSGKGLW